MKNVKRALEFDGVSSTGTRHGLLVEEGADGLFRFTVTGANGKRHASVLLAELETRGVSQFIDLEYQK